MTPGKNVSADAGFDWMAELFTIATFVHDPADALDIRQGTVKTHIKNIYRRIRVKNKVELLLRFMADISQLLGESDTGAVVPIVDTEA